MPSLYIRNIMALCLLIVSNLSLNAQKLLERSDYLLQDGLSHRLSLDFAQDNSGLIWVATFDGLNLFTGQEFIDFEDELIGRPVTRSRHYKALSIDKKGTLWAGTLGGEVLSYNLSENKLTEWDKNDNIDGLQLIGSIDKMEIAPNGYLWLTGTESWSISPPQVAVEYCSKDGECAVLAISEDIPYRVFDILSDAASNLWLFTSGGYYYIDAVDGDIEKVSENEVNGRIPIDVDNRLWYPKLTLKKTLTYLTLPDTLRRQDFIHFLFDNQSNLWLKHKSGAVYHLEVKTGHFSIAGYFPIYPDNIFNIYEAHDAILWTSRSEGGITKIAENSLNITPILNAPTGLDGYKKDDISFYDLAECTNGSIYTHNAGGSLYQIDPNTFDELKVSIPIGYNASNKNEVRINGLLSSKEKDFLWMGSRDHGLIRYDSKRDKWANFPLKGLSGVRPLVLDDQGIIWAEIQDSMILFDTKNLEYTSPPTGMPIMKFANADIDQQVIWGLKDTNLIKINTTKQTWEKVKLYDTQGRRLIPSHCILPHNGSIWFGSKKGLIKYDYNAGKTQVFTTLNGLPHNRVYSIQGLGNKLWIGTYNGISEFNLVSTTFKNYNKSDRMSHPQCNDDAGLLDSKGNFYVGTKNGISILKPFNVESSKNNSPLRLISVSKYNKRKQENSTIYNFSSSKNTPLRFGPYDQAISFSVAIINFVRPEKNQYSFKLLGFDDAWSAPSIQSTMTYSHLPAGKYTLQVKGFDHSGSNANEILKIPIIVQSPWYARWWAIILWLVLSVAVLGVIYRLRVRYVQRHLETRRLSELNAQKTQLYTQLTHEFRTPLSVILGLADQLRAISIDANNKEKDFDSGHIKEKLNTITRNANELLSLVSNILNLSKSTIETEGQELVEEDVILFSKLISLTYETYANTQGINLIYSSSFVRLKAQFDKNQLRTILSNLLSNAVKYTGKGGTIKIHLDTESSKQRSQKDGTIFLRISIEDNGRGIRDEHQEHVFDKWFRANQDDGIEGSGIGLSIVKEMVESTGGEIQLFSELGKGTRIITIIPIQAIGSNIANEISGYENLFSSDSMEINVNLLDPERPHILVMEDHVELASYIKDILSPNYEVTLAQNGEVGINLAKKIIPDLIVSDIMMPSRDGYDVLTTLKADTLTGHIPIILLTAKSDYSSKIQGLKKGADAYLIKPFEQIELISHIDNMIKARHIWQQRNVIEVDKDGENNAIHKNELSSEHAFLQQIRDIIEKNLDQQPFGVKELSKTLHLSQSQLYRKIKALTGMSIAGYIRHLRLTIGRKMLIETQESISEIAFRIGFSSLQYFSDQFVKKYGERPSKIRDKIDISSRNAE